MQFSRFTSLLLGALIGALLLTLITFFVGFSTAAAYTFGVGFVIALVAIVAARMLEANPAQAIPVQAVSVQAGTSPAAVRSTSANTVPSTTSASFRERPPAARAPRTESALATADGARLFGNVKWFNRAKGYGFIHCDDEREVFVHHRNLRGDERQALQDGERVSFHIVERNRGPQAEDVAVEAR